jgi:tetratricopeptide (TPR) repeat protein
VDYMEQKQDGLAYFLTAAHDLAALYGAIGDWKSAEPIFAKSHYVRGRVWGADHENTATAAMMLGVARYSLANYAEAEKLLDACIAVRRKVFGASHPQVALALMNLAAVYDRTGRADQASALRRDAEGMGLPDAPS